MKLDRKLRKKIIRIISERLPTDLGGDDGLYKLEVVLVTPKLVQLKCEHQLTKNTRFLEIIVKENL